MEKNITKNLVNTLIYILNRKGFVVTGQVKKGYRGIDEIWVEIDSIGRSKDCAGGVCVNARIPGNKTTTSTSINWFTGNFGAEKKKKDHA